MEHVEVTAEDPLLPGIEIAVWATFVERMNGCRRGASVQRVSSSARSAVTHRAISSRVARTQPTVSYHLKVLRQAGIVGSEREGLWAYYYVIPDALEELSAWLS
jgi:DNA-binding transcriptional ArsR family regulator